MNPFPKFKRQTKVTINSSKNNSIIPPLKSLRTILKEKLLYDYICNIHNSIFNKYCISCKKDICTKCETESHQAHKLLHYENIIPDFNEINSIHRALIGYKKNILNL